jgi:hypothetical protein
MVKQRNSLIYILTLCAGIFAAAGMLVGFGGGKSASAAIPSELEVSALADSVEIQVEVSDPVFPTLTKAVRDLPPFEAGKLEYRELRPRVWTNPDFDPAFRSKGGLDPLLAVQANAPGPSDRDFDTPIFNFDGGPHQFLNPPDTNGDVGANHYIQMINATLVSIYDKATAALITSFQLTDLGGCTTGNGDPIVLYDQAADRWLLSEFGPGSSLCVLISQTPDPTGAYFSYQFSTPGFPDYPKYGIWPDAYYASTNESSPAVYAMDRAQMLAGLPATSQRFTATTLAGFPFQAMIPSDLDGATPPPANSPNYFMRHRDDEVHNVGSNDPTEDYLEIWEFHIDFATPANSTFTHVLPDIAVAEFDSDLCGLVSFSCFPQPGSATQLDPLREVIMWRLQYRNFGSHETLVGNLVTDVDGTDRGGVRWFELRKTGANPWSLYQEGTYSPDAVNRWMGAIAMDGSGNIALGYNVTDATSTFPGLRYVGRLASDPLGTMPQGEYTLIAGTAANGSNRYGDYSSMSVDPVDDCTFWFTGEYNVSSQWSTRIGAFKFDSCGASDFTLDVDPLSQDVCIPDDAIYDITVGQVQIFTDPVTLSTAGVPAGYSDAFSVNPVIPPGTSVLTLTNTGAATAGAYALDIIGTAPTSTHTTTVGLNLLDAVPGVSTLVAPPDGAPLVPLAPTFEWTAVAGASSYDLEVATDPGFTTIVYTASVAGTSHTATSDLVAGTLHYWRVTAVNACGGGSPSAVWSFTTEIPPGSCGPGTVPNVLYSTDFESGDAGWTHSGTGDTWALSSANPNSGSIAYHADDVATVSDQRLVSPAVVLPTGQDPLSLQFFNYQELEDSSSGCWDGGILEVSDNGGATWTQVLDPALLTDPYDGIVSSSFGNPLAGLPAWCGDPQPYLNSIVDLNAYAGSTVQFRFRLGTDTSVNHPGWDIDDVVVQSCTPVAEIAVAPASLSGIQLVDVQVTHPMTITNGGLADLDWSIFEDNPIAAAPAIFAPGNAIADLALSLPASTPRAERRPAAPNALLYDQTDNPGTNGAPSQTFPDFGNDYGHAADDFIVPTGGWTITGTRVLGQYSVGPSPVWDVNIYADAGGMPGSLLYSFADIVATSDVSGDVTLDFPHPAALREGTYWLSVVADMALVPTGQFFWNTRVVQTGNPYHWTQSGLFVADCIGFWGPGASVCNVGGGVEPDLLFALYGSVGGTCFLPPEDIPWASVDPITGTTAAGLSTLLDVTFDSTGLSAGVYTGTLCIDSNAANAPLVAVPLTMTVAAYGMELSPDQALPGMVGTIVTYTVQITNTGNVADVFDLSASGSTWTTTLSQGNISLSAGQSSSFTVMVSVPAGAANNAMDTATITATSQGDGGVSASTDLTTTATGQEYLLYLPIVPKLYP